MFPLARKAHSDAGHVFLLLIALGEHLFDFLLQSGRLGDDRAAQSDVLARVIAMVQNREQAERDKAIAPLKAESAELRGQVSALLTLLGQKSFKAADVIADLPNWRQRDVA